ncbi:MAG: hydantoinase B/oxoprolinase family protein [Planctomycetota bacterium]
MPASGWKFAIDVGGTFTDCLGYSPDGLVQRHKLLSSGVTKGSVGSASTASYLVDSSRVGDPTDFWVGFRLQVLDSDGTTLAEAVVSSFDAELGRLELSSQLTDMPLVGSTYELSCGLEAPVIGIRYLLRLRPDQDVPAVRLRLGTTRGTNTLLTRSGKKTALLTTRGFGDLLDIGYQDRPKLFELTIRKPKPLTTKSIEIDERVAADGQVLVPLDEARVEQQLTNLHNEGIDAVAICLLHADLFPQHEIAIAGIAKRIGFCEVSRSSEVAPVAKLVSRAETTVVDAYLRPVLREYLDQLQSSLPDSEIRLMTSAGGLVSPDSFRGHESVLSGPAGGVVGYARAARIAGFKRAIGFDMGGTSTDVSRYDGYFEFEYETRKAGARLIAPTLAIETVAAGGGSICQFDGAKLSVGPDSAGANPGPACYGRGGPLTVTDVNFYLGRILQERFPFALDRSAVEARIAELAKSVRDATGEHLTFTQLAEGLLEIANANMTSAVRGVSIAKGADPKDYVLVAFGGAAAQHACAVARQLGIKRVLNHPDAGILSAFGIGCAEIVRHAVAGMSTPLEQLQPSSLADQFDRLAAAPVQALMASGVEPEKVVVERSLDLRYVGTDEPLNLPHSDDLQVAFEHLHRRRFGYIHEHKGVEVVAVRVRAVGQAEQPQAYSTCCDTVAAIGESTTTICFGGEQLKTAAYTRETLSPGMCVEGPAIIADVHSTVVIDPGWQAEMLSGGELLLRDREDVHDAKISRIDAVMLEVFNNLFAGIATQMGHVLRRTSSSVNVKERLDYSCAVFSADGELIANAPHVPVHLGAMGETVRHLLDARNSVSPGDVYATNDPYRGGSHLPDITVVTPVHCPSTGKLLFFTACRAHHAEIGGVRPGSMPPGSTSLAEEGVLISDFALVDGGITRVDELRKLLSSGPYPSRRVEENLADLDAQVAANQQGANDLLALVDQYSFDLVEQQIRSIQAAAETKVRQALCNLGIENCDFTDYLDTIDGTSVPICVRIRFNDRKDGPAATIDFAGTAPVVAGNLNANRAIVTAAVLYVLRLLVGEDLPLNEGALRAVDILLPTCLLNPPAGQTPETTPAVAAGNVETSQRVVDVLLGALGVAGASQGTMNNLLFGNESFGYYETIAGGSGATAAGHGADAVQIHMTNTRATDPEVLERRLPVRLWEFSIRRDSGGDGRHRGGDGVVRRLEFLEPLQVSLITGRRGPHPPYGAQGGAPGQFGKNNSIRHDGSYEPLHAICEFSVQPGDQLEIQTPGGGGFGKSSTENSPTLGNGVGS